jgi:F0F1-type ATP synthase assembly protein I
MSFSEEDKEALGEDLDEIKESLKSINRISKDLRTLVTMAWVYIILSVVAGVLIGIGIGIS